MVSEQEDEDVEEDDEDEVPPKAGLFGGLFGAKPDEEASEQDLYVVRGARFQVLHPHAICFSHRCQGTNEWSALVLKAVLLLQSVEQPL